MRKVKKLALSKETIRNLVDRESRQVVGGVVVVVHTASHCAKVCDSMWDCTYTNCSNACL
jgi:hypothetical protein